MYLRLRTRLILGLLLPIVVVGAVATFVGAGLIGRSLSSQAQHNLKLDINSARLIYRKAVGEALEQVRLITFDPVVRGALEGAVAGAKPDDVALELERLRRQGTLDVLDLLDLSGRVLARARTPASRGDSLAHDPVVRAVLEGREAMVASEVAPPEELAREAAELTRRARISLPATAGTPAVEEARGLMLRCAVVVKGERGQRIGVLYGARLLNRDERIVNEIYQTIFKGESYRGKQVGEATLFLDDIRIATIAVTKEGAPAIGTRVAPEVRDRVLTAGESWVGRASVVGDRHITAYEPIRDSSGRVVGALALGILEAKFTDIRRDALAAFLAITLGGVVLSLVLAGFMTSKVTAPMRRLVEAVKHVAGGDLEQQVQIDTSVEEIAQLGRHINQMARALRERDRAIQRQTQEKISRSERLAIVGRLSAGVAHQINNPLGGIMLFSNLLLRKFPEPCIERENLERIANEAKRCQRIVQGLLDFARHREPKLERTDIKNVVEKALQLVENQALFLNIETERRYAEDAPAVRIDVAQMQEVFLNLVLNAVESMNGRGKLTISTATVDQGGAVRVSIADTGCGVAEDQIERIFEPFFTTKEVGKGTGLGLSISRGIVESHGGNIWAESKLGEGTTFHIRLVATVGTPLEGAI